MNRADGPAPAARPRASDSAPPAPEGEAGTKAGAGEIPAAGGGSPGAITPLKEARRQFERQYVLSVLERCGWSIAAAARALGLQRPNFYRKARQLRITLRRPAPPCPGAD